MQSKPDRTSQSEEEGEKNAEERVEGQESDEEKDEKGEDAVQVSLPVEAQQKEGDKAKESGGLEKEVEENKLNQQVLEQEMLEDATYETVDVRASMSSTPRHPTETNIVSSLHPKMSTSSRSGFEIIQYLFNPFSKFSISCLCAFYAFLITSLYICVKVFYSLYNP